MKRSPLVIVQDTREQAPLPLAHVIRECALPFEVQRGTLATGDYCLADAPHLCLVERKSLPDLVGVVGHGRARFERELVRLESETEIPVLLIEGTADQVLARAYPGTIHPNAILGSVASWSVDFGVHVHWCGSPLAAAHVALRIFAAVARRVARGELRVG